MKNVKGPVMTSEEIYNARITSEEIYNARITAEDARKAYVGDRVLREALAKVYKAIRENMANHVSVCCSVPESFVNEITQDLRNQGFSVNLDGDSEENPEHVYIWVSWETPAHS